MEHRTLQMIDDLNHDEWFYVEVDGYFTLERLTDKFCEFAVAWEELAQTEDVSFSSYLAEKCAEIEWITNIKVTFPPRVDRAILY